MLGSEVEEIIRRGRLLSKRVEKATAEGMTREKAIDLLIDCEHLNDTEAAHGMADDILRSLLVQLGYEDVVDRYDQVDKWFA